MVLVREWLHMKFNTQLLFTWLSIIYLLYQENNLIWWDIHADNHCSLNLYIDNALRGRLYKGEGTQ